ncbi:MAG: hypothetical protein ABW201_14220 [Candidatus Thiodiazotropha sp.]
MNGETGTYTFLPWLRHGISNRIVTADHDVAVLERAAITVNLGVHGTGGENGDVNATIPREVELYGPGDIIGVESRAIIKTEPLNWITNFEPNYLPYIEFYDEDFPWRYTPAAPAGGRLRPWLCLIVLKKGVEYRPVNNLQDHKLPAIEILEADLDTVFPPADELWAWAHVHVNRNLTGDGAAPQATNIDSALSQLQGVIADEPDLAYARITCPRKLEPNCQYEAFLVPTFETGRLAGLGKDPATAPHATFSAWGEGRDEPELFPYYHRWYFRTGLRGDFEYLVRLLEPRLADIRVGRRDMDVQDPGSNIPGITDPELEGVLKLGGALLAPLSDEAELELAKWEEWDQMDYPHPFQSTLAAFVNLADTYSSTTPGEAHQDPDLDEAIRDDPDPMITPPIYGRWHALVNRLLDGPNQQNWVHQLNLDPRWRSAAGFGTDVIIDNQEEYMDAAWDQIGDVIEANKRIRLAQLARRASQFWYDTQLQSIAGQSTERLVMFSAPVARRVLHNGVTVAHQVRHSPVTPAMTSGAMRRMLRPRGRLATLAGFNDEIGKNNFLERLNRGIVTAAPPNTVPSEVVTVEDLVDEMKPGGALGDILDRLAESGFLRNLPWLLALLVIVLVLLIGAGFLAGGIVAAGLVALGFYIRRLLDRLKAATDVEPENNTPESIDRLPPNPGFELQEDIAADSPTEAAPPGETGSGDMADSAEAARFKDALRDAYLAQTQARDAGRPAPVVPVDLAGVAVSTVAQLDPQLTLPRYVLGQIMIPPYLLEQLREEFVEVMAYPEFDIPMYKPLADRSTDLFVPNLNYIKQNTITLLNTNQKFIEAYMVGLNHEFARELLWREYVTDQRGSYFRQFWDVSAFLSETEDDEERREELKDMPEYHLWSKFSKLGDHDNREQGRENEEELVLVIRGELLKKYPNAVIYAQKARWPPTSETDPTPNKNAEREFDTSVPIKTPLYEAQVEPDIYFFGFDLTEDVARGNPEVDDEPGWFFVIRERPGEPRFGFDIEREGTIQVWNDLAWGDVVPGVQDGVFINISEAPTRSLPNTQPGGTAQEKIEQWQEDHLLSWTNNITSAELAYIMFQAPVLVGVHAAEMLPKT